MNLNELFGEPGRQDGSPTGNDSSTDNPIQDQSRAGGASGCDGTSVAL
jgi:hypothetical protein